MASEFKLNVVSGGAGANRARAQLRDERQLKGVAFLDAL